MRLKPVTLGRATVLAGRQRREGVTAKTSESRRAVDHLRSRPDGITQPKPGSSSIHSSLHPPAMHRRRRHDTINATARQQGLHHRRLGVKPTRPTPVRKESHCHGETPVADQRLRQLRITTVRGPGFDSSSMTRQWRLTVPFRAVMAALTVADQFTRHSARRSRDPVSARLGVAPGRYEVRLMVFSSSGTATGAPEEGADGGRNLRS